MLQPARVWPSKSDTKLGGDAADPSGAAPTTSVEASIGAGMEPFTSGPALLSCPGSMLCPQPQTPATDTQSSAAPHPPALARLRVGLRIGGAGCIEASLRRNRA